MRVAPDLGPAWERATRDAFAAWTPAPWPYHVVVSADARDDRQRCVVSVIGASLSSPTHVTWGLTDYGVIHVETRLETDDALKRAILTHEVGHAFGLGHVQDDKRAVMWPFITIGGVPTCRDRHDLDRLWGIGPESCDR